MRFTPANGNYSHILYLADSVSDSDILNSACTLVVESVSWDFTKNYTVISLKNKLLNVPLIPCVQIC